MRIPNSPVPSEKAFREWQETFERELKNFDLATTRLMYVCAWAHGHVQATKESVARLWGHQ
jgi:hypothetical protein